MVSSNQSSFPVYQPTIQTFQEQYTPYILSNQCLGGPGAIPSYHASSSSPSSETSISPDNCNVGGARSYNSGRQYNYGAASNHNIHYDFRLNSAPQNTRPHHFNNLADPPAGPPTVAGQRPFIVPGSTGSTRQGGMESWSNMQELFSPGVTQYQNAGCNYEPCSMSDFSLPTSLGHLGMTEKQLMDTPTRELNRILKGKRLSRNVIKELKDHRRTIKNRNYAANTRTKREKEAKDLESKLNEQTNKNDTVTKEKDSIHGENRTVYRNWGSLGQLFDYFNLERNRPCPIPTWDETSRNRRTKSIL